MPPHVREAFGRDPREDRNPLDMASFYVEELKYGPGPAKLEGVSNEQIATQLDALLRDADVMSMSGDQLRAALEFYARSCALLFRVPLVLARSIFVDGVMHGIAFAGGVSAEPRPETGDA